METLSQLHKRIQDIALASLNQLSPKQGPTLPLKVDENGNLLPFPGNTVVFLLSENEYKIVSDIQNALYAAFEGTEHIFAAEPLKPETFHMTLHDLANPTNSHTVENTRRKALDILARVKRDFPDPVDMKLTWVYSMMNTSLLLGLEPVDEDSCQRLLGMYERFHELVYPDWPYLTPHITLAYYKPGDVRGDQLERLKKFANDFSGRKHIFRLLPENLVYQEFGDMNNYRTVTEP